MCGRASVWLFAADSLSYWSSSMHSLDLDMGMDMDMESKPPRL